MKKTKLTRTLLAACSIVALSAVMYGCTGDGSENDLTATQSDLEKAEMERDAALAAQAAAEAERDAANAAAAAANAAAAAAAEAQATAEAERDAANAAAAAAAQAQMDAEAAQAAAEAAQAAAEAAQATAEAAQAAAEMAQADAETAQAAAEQAQAAAETRADNAEAARTAAEDARAAAAAAQATAEAAAAAAADAQAAAEAAQGMAEAERDAANAAAAQAAMDQQAAEDARDAAMQAQSDAEDAQAAAEAAQATAEGERDAANAAAAAAAEAQSMAEGARDAALAAQATAEGERDTANADLATANANLETANADLAAAITRAETAEADLAQANSDLEEARARIAALEGGTAPDVLDPIKTAASDAATAAGEAGTAARTAADAAETAAMNRATIQTGMANSAADAADADIYADMAEAEAMKASDASAMAQAAMNAGAATPHRLAAEAAQEAAEEAQGMAEDAQGEAEADAMAELKIDGTMKSVGDITIDADAPNNVITTGTGATAKVVDTGFQMDLQEEMTGAVTPGVAFVAATSPAEDTEYVQQVAARDIAIGKTVDSANDMARLAIVTHYVGSKTVKVFAYDETDPEVDSTADGRTGTKRGYVTLADDDTDNDDTNNTRLRSLGMYYQAGADNNADALEAADEVANDAEGMEVYSYVDTQDTEATADDVTVYLVMDSQRTDGGTTTYVYRRVDIDAVTSDDVSDGTANTDIDNAAGAGFEADGGRGVTAMIPEATAYDHIHFGVWAALGDDGTTPSHGIGFVQSIGDGMTAADDMPNFGSATYDGNWVATVQAADPDGNGAVSLTDGMATLTADFDDDEVMVNLMGLAMLEGDISGGMFSGDKATVGADNTNNLTGGEDFTGSFNGAFFGTNASEAGGVFDFGSDDNEAGAFRGSFGGAR